MIDPISSSLSQLQSFTQKPGAMNPGMEDGMPIRLPDQMRPADGASAPARIGPAGAPPPPDKAGFGGMVGGLINAVEQKNQVAQQEAKKLMLGESDNIHRSMIAMQESGLAFTLLVEVRNKLVESYQELMRMPV